MKYLLDTHALLWWLNDHDRLSPDAREIISERGLSMGNCHEIRTRPFARCIAHTSRFCGCD